MTDLQLSGFHPLMRDMIAVAVDLGWNPHQDARGARGKQNVTLHSYNGEQTVLCTPIRQINESKLATMRRKVIKYADPIKRLQAVARIEWAEKHGGDVATAIVETLPSTVEALITDEVRIPNPTITEERPWLARKTASKRGGKVYESPAVTERVWSDQHVDYVCAFPGCGWQNERARSVANHYGAQHTTKGEAVPKPQEPTYPAGDYYEPLTHRAYKPQQRLIDALAEWLTERSWDNTDQLAVLMLTWAHERPDLPDVEPESRGPLTPEQILEAVRELVGAPLASRLVQAQEEAQGLAESIAELTAQVLTRDALIERLRDERRTLADLLAEEQS